MSLMISINKAKKMLNKKCIGYLGHIMTKKDKSGLKVNKTPVVQKFHDVFLKKLSRLAQEKKSFI